MKFSTAHMAGSKQQKWLKEETGKFLIYTHLK